MTLLYLWYMNISSINEYMGKCLSYCITITLNTSKILSKYKFIIWQLRYGFKGSAMTNTSQMWLFMACDQSITEYRGNNLLFKIDHYIPVPVGMGTRETETSLWASSHNMMTSSNGNIFHVTGPLCWEFTGHRWFPLTKPVTLSFEVFFHLHLNKQLCKQSKC